MKEEKERRVKVLTLLFICEWLKMRKQPPKTIKETFVAAASLRGLLFNIQVVQSKPLPRHEKGGLAIVGNSRNPESIVTPEGKIYTSNERKT